MLSAVLIEENMCDSGPLGGIIGTLAQAVTVIEICRGVMKFAS